MPVAPDRQLARFLAKFTPELAATAHAVLAKVRTLVPGALEVVYDNYNALAIGFSATERASDFVFSIALDPKWVSMFFMHGPSLPDPKRLLRGSGTMVRHIVLDDGAATLDRPAVRALLKAALRLAERPIDPEAEARIVIKSVSKTQRPRRPSTLR